MYSETRNENYKTYLLDAAHEHLLLVDVPRRRSATIDVNNYEALQIDTITYSNRSA